jgi:hypothetical protein
MSLQYSAILRDWVPAYVRQVRTRIIESNRIESEQMDQYEQMDPDAQMDPDVQME